MCIRDRYSRGPSTTGLWQKASQRPASGSRSRWQSWSRSFDSRPIVDTMNAKLTTSRWVRVQHAADLLEVSPSTVRRWAANGRLVCERTPSGQRRFLIDDLQSSYSEEGCPSHLGLAAGRHTGKRYQLLYETCLLYTSPSPRDGLLSRMPSSA